MKRLLYAAIASLFAIPLFAQGQTGIVPIITNDPIGEYLTKGGSAAVILIMFYFYRRDFLSGAADSKEEKRAMIELVQAATKAQTEVAVTLNTCIRAMDASTAATASNTSAVQRLTDHLQHPVSKSTGA